MIADDLQHLVERYLSGAMSSEETRSFLTRAGHDRELRRLLDADRIITGAIARDTASTMPGATVPGASLMAALEMSRTVAQPVAGSWMNLRVAVIGVTIGLAGLVAGSFLVAPMLGTSSDRAPAVSTPTVTTPIDKPVAPGAPESPSVDATSPAATTNVSPDAGDDANGSRAASTSSSAGSTRGDRSAAREGARPSSTERAPTTSTASRPRSAADEVDTRSPNALPSYDDETLPIEFDVKPKGK
jgi:hypothetical protein